MEACEVKPSSCKRKGRKLQVELAEQLSVLFGLTIEATPPTKPGVREATGAVYVPVHAFPDLRVKRMGEAGADVELLTPKAAGSVRLDGHPIWWECKNVERGWDIGAGFWRTGSLSLVTQAFEQAKAAKPLETTTVVVISKNRHPTLAAWLARTFEPSPRMRPQLLVDMHDDLVVLTTLELFFEYAFRKSHP